MAQIRALSRIMAGSAAVFAAICAPAFAQADQSEITVGVGGAVLPSYNGSDDYKVTPGVFVRGKVAGFPFFARGTNLHVDLIRNGDSDGLDIGLGPVVSARFDRTGGIKDSRVKALGKLDTAWEVGGWAGIAKTGVLTSDYDNLSFRAAYVADIGGAHKSYVITPAVEYVMPLSEKTLVGFSLSADYVGKRFGGYYFNITPTGSSASGLNAYAGAGKAGFAKFNAGVLAAQSLSGDLRKGWAVFAGAGYGRLLGRYADSPIVKDAGRRDQWLGGLGIAYTF
ncbi:MAG: MipA/OmpV family protein [Sphingobium sp.]